MSPSCQSPHTDVSRSVKNKKKHYACKIHIAGEIFFVIQMAFHIILPSSFKKPCRMWLQKMTSILSKCLFSQVAEMTWPIRHPFKSCFRTNEVGNEPNVGNRMLVFVIIPLYSILSLKASKVLGNGIWGFIEALCHYEVEMAAFIRSSPAFFLSSSPTFLGLGESSI